MGLILFKSCKFENCKKADHYTFDIECVKCKKVTVYCMDCNYPEYKDCCHSPKAFVNMRIPRIRNFNKSDYVWNTWGYFETREEATQRFLAEARLEKICREKREAEARRSFEEFERKRALTACKSCYFGEISDNEPRSPWQKCDKCHAEALEAKRKRQCRICFTDLKPKQNLYCDKHINPKCTICSSSYAIDGYSICHHCSKQCINCKQSVDSPKYETIRIRNDYCPKCGHNHTSQCQATVEKTIRGINTYYDTQIGPGLYYNNAILREVPFSIKKEMSCDCEFPTTFKRKICEHVQRNLSDYYVN